MLYTSHSNHLSYDTVNVIAHCVCVCVRRVDVMCNVIHGFCGLFSPMVMNDDAMSMQHSECGEKSAAKWLKQLSFRLVEAKNEQMPSER